MAFIHLKSYRGCFQVLKDTFTMDYNRTLKFQNIPEEMDIVPQQPAKSVKITIPEADQILD